MRRSTLSTGIAGIALLVTFLVMPPVSEGADQGAQAKKKASKKTPTVETKSSSRARTDSIAAAVADSIRKVERAHAVADSTRKAKETAARIREDSLKTFRLRKIRNDAFAVGERLVFDVSYGPVTAGEAFMTIPRYDSVAGRKCFKVQFGVNSLPSFSWIYKVEDRYLTYIDVETIAPLKFEQHVREGGYSMDFVAEFDQVKHIARTPDGVYPIPEYVHDILSAFYYVRTIDFSGMKTGDTMTLFNFYRDKSHELVVKILGRQELEIEAGTFNTIVVEPMVKEGGLFKSEGRIVIWLSDDDLKIPVRVNTKVVIGSIDVELREYSGISRPVRARIR
jgi:hypothetical protein